MKAAFRAMLTAVVMGCVFEVALAADYAAQRKRDADRAVAALDKNRKSIDGAEYLLLSLSKEVSLSELRPLVERTKVKLTGVYLCAEGGGVMAVHLEPGKQPWAQLSDASSANGVHVTMTKAQEQMSLLGGEIRFSGHDQYCGVDAQGTYEQLASFRAALKPRTYMTEITSARVRMAPANVAKR